MAKTRLNVGHRDALRHFASTNINCDAEQKARDKAYAKAAKAVRAAVEKRFPVRDMAILEKYSVASPDKCIKGGNPAGAFVRFSFDHKDDGPLCPSRSCGTRSIPFDQATCDAIDSLQKANDVLEKARTAKYAAYKSLVASAVTFEEVLEIWPAAEALRERICARSTALVALSDDIRQFIQTDNAGKQLEAAA